MPMPSRAAECIPFARSHAGERHELSSEKTGGPAWLTFSGCVGSIQSPPRARANSGLTGQLPKVCNLNCENRDNLLCQ